MLGLSNIAGRAAMLAMGIAVLLVAGCGTGETEQTQVASVTPTAIATTAPVALPTATATAEPTPTVAVVPVATSTPLPEPTAEPTPTVEPTTAADVAEESVPAPTEPAAAAPTPTEVATESGSDEETPTPTVEPTAAVEAPTPEPDGSAVESDIGDADSGGDTAATATPEPTPTVSASGEPPVECYDRDVKIYRGFVDGVDSLSFENGRVYCSGAGTNAVSAAASYRHSSGLVVQRNGDFIFNAEGTAYIPYSGTVHFCMNGQPGSAPVRADTVPALLVVIDNEAQRQVAQGASSPAGFSGGAADC